MSKESHDDRGGVSSVPDYLTLLASPPYYSISKLKLTLSASPCRIIYTGCGSPSRHV
jgi:hypothetical protein